MGLIVTALMAIAGGLGLFHALVAVSLLTCLRANPDMALVSPDMDLLIVISSLWLAWILAFFQNNIVSYRHLGTRFYGRKPTEQGYITTKWLVAGLPLLPIRSYQVSRQIKNVSFIEYESQQNVMDAVEGYFDWGQMLRTALISYGTISWCLGCLGLMLNSSCF